MLRIVWISFDLAEIESVSVSHIDIASTNKKKYVNNKWALPIDLFACKRIYGKFMQMCAFRTDWWARCYCSCWFECARERKCVKSNNDINTFNAFAFQIWLLGCATCA